MTRSRRAVTLIEILVVMAIIAILIGLLFQRGSLWPYIEQNIRVYECLRRDPQSRGEDHKGNASIRKPRSGNPADKRRRPG